jgi:succinate-semialdehyde dehydrogenase / glutarate-semialdehyde dehydrogenase
MKSINPYTNKLICEFKEFTDTELDEILLQSDDAFRAWRKTSFEFRKNLMINAAHILREKSGEYAEAITSEMGKPISESKAEVEKCAWVCDYYAENAQRFLASEKVTTDADESYVNYEPIGTVLGIMPWNFPFWQVFRFAAPTLMAGNTVLLKHSSNVQICASHIEDIFRESGFPVAVFRNLVIGSTRVERIIGNDIIKAVSLTGSEFAGQKVAEAAGKNIKKVLLELGGSNAFVVLADADIKKAAETGVRARMMNAGQSCIAAKRFIVDKTISDRFIESFIFEMNKIKAGDPSKDDINLGPLASLQQAEEVEKQVNNSVKMGARLLAGGIRQKSFFSPALLVDVRPGMPVFDEEVFGPVAPVIIAKDTVDAIQLANQTKFGLGLTLFTSDLEKARELIPEFHDGAVFINAMVKSDPRLPFGGTGKSGFGRELAIQGIREFVNVKTVYVKK